MTDIYKAPEAQLQENTQNAEYGSIESALVGNYEFRPTEVISQAWANLKGMKTTYWLACIVYAVIYGVIGGLISFAMGSMVDSVTGEFSVVGLLGQIVLTLAMGPLAAGLYMIPIKYSVGAKIEVGELFKHFDKTLPLFLMTALLYLTVALGLILLVIPGVYLLVSYAFAFPLMIEKNMGPWEALNTSRKAVTHKWFSMAGFYLLIILIVLIGFVALFIGVLWAIPLVGLASAVAYRDIFGVEEKTINGE